MVYHVYTRLRVVTSSSVGGCVLVRLGMGRRESLRKWNWEFRFSHHHLRVLLVVERCVLYEREREFPQKRHGGGVTTRGKNVSRGFTPTLEKSSPVWGFGKKKRIREKKGAESSVLLFLYSLPLSIGRVLPPLVVHV